MRATPEDLSSLMTEEEKKNAVIVADIKSIAWRYAVGELQGPGNPQDLIRDARLILMFVKHHPLLAKETTGELLKQLEAQSVLRDPTPVSSLMLCCLSPGISGKEVVKVALATYALLVAVAGEEVHTEAPQVRQLIHWERVQISENKCTTPLTHLSDLMGGILITFQRENVMRRVLRCFAQPWDLFHGIRSMCPTPNATDKCPCGKHPLDRDPTPPQNRDGTPQKSDLRSRSIIYLGNLLLTGPPGYYPYGVTQVHLDSLETHGSGQAGKNSQVRSSPLNPMAEIWQPLRGGLPIAAERQPCIAQNHPATTAPAPQDQPDDPGRDASKAQAEGRPATAPTLSPGSTSEDMLLSSPDAHTVTIDEDSDESIPDLEPIPNPMPVEPADSVPTPRGGIRIECVACLEPVENPEHRLCILGCGHNMHTTCAESWLCQANTCPVCRDTCTVMNPGMLPTGEPRSLTFNTGAFLTNIACTVEHRARLRRLGLAGPTLHVSMPSTAGMPASSPNIRRLMSPATCVRDNRGSDVGSMPARNRPNQGRNITVTIGRNRAIRGAPNSGEMTPDPRRRPPRPPNRGHRNNNRRPHRGQPNSNNNYSMTPWARLSREDREDTDSPAMTRRRTTPLTDQVMTFTLHIIYAILLTFVLMSLPLAKGDMVESLPPTKPMSPAQISKHREGDVIIFESYPRSISLALTSEEIDLNVLFRLKAKLTNLGQYAESLAGNNLVPLAQAAGYCRSHGYATSLMPVLSKSLKFPHFLQLHEEMNSAERVYVAILREDAAKSRFCNYTLSYSAKFSLTSVLDIGSSYYTVDRNAKYNIYRTWLTDAKGRQCEDGLQIHRGEIVARDTEFEMIIDHTDGSVFSCQEYCHNLNGLREQALRNAMCVLGETCVPFANTHCETYSYSWKYNRCRLSSKAAPARDLATHDGWNSLVAFRECKALVQHQKARILVNDTLHDISHVCQFGHVQPPATSSVYRSCPGISFGLQKDINPLESMLDGYILSLEGTNQDDKEMANLSLPLENIGVREKRGTHTAAAPVMLTALKPALVSFLKIGTSHLSSGIGLQFLGNALPLANILLLATNLIALAVGIATGLSPTVYHEPMAKLTEVRPQTFTDWSVVKSPNLYRLNALSDACKTARDIRHSDAIPELLKEVGDSLKSLQVPLSRLISDSDPLSDKVHGHISREGGDTYGFWTTYYPSRRTLVRFFTYQVVGDADTMTRQAAVLSGSSLAPISEGTLIQGGTRKPGSLGPSWNCVEYITSARDKNSSWLPDTCYGAPINLEPIHYVPFLPNARIYRIFGKHRAEYSCPHSSQGTIISRGLLVLLVPNECAFLIDSVPMRPADPSSTSAWMKPFRLVDRSTEYPARREASYPKSLHHAISTLANDTLMPAITNINVQAGGAREVQYLNDIGLAIAMCIIAILCSAAIYYVYRKLSHEQVWPLMTSQAMAARLRLPARWTRSDGDSSLGEAGGATVEVVEPRA